MSTAANILAWTDETPQRQPSAAAAAQDFFSFSRVALAQLLKTRFALPAYRSVQLFEWVYRRGITNFSEMTNLSQSAKECLNAAFCFPEARIAQREISTDGTRKYLLQVSGGDLIECVMIKQPTRMTLCVSSQVGCGMGCAFCRTATMGFRRHLSAAEIIWQVRAVLNDAKNFGDTFQNVVFMGMGEPLHNLENVVTAVNILADPYAFSVPARKITVSTVGLVKGIERFGNSGAECSLAVSLNATTDEVRSKIMPVNRAAPIHELIKCLENFPLKPRKRITIEYVMLSGVNDTDQDLERLPKLLRKLRAKVNLIPYNENAQLGFKAPPRERIHKWRNVLLSKGLNTTIRWSKGMDIKAACGQLAVPSLKQM